ncbi:MAG: hypothetical protein K6E60_02050 [Saccharofermentans sp.]|nr:hypothetical protein [Saccharofermentans sp.]
MRSIDDQMNEIKRRKNIYKQAKNLRNKMIGECTVGVVCLVLMVCGTVFIPGIDLTGNNAQILQYGSIIKSLPVIGYLLIAILAFVMGVAVTMACIHWKERKEKEQEI